MCAVMHFAEAVPLRSLQAKAVAKAFIKFFTTFGLPKHMQSDKENNFMSTGFSQVMQELSVKHPVLSAIIQRGAATTSVCYSTQES